MSNARRVAVVMAGGSGERFWPLSRKDRPKQLLHLTDPDQTMLHEAAARVIPIVGEGNVYVSTNRGLADVITQAGIAPMERVFAEPAKRNTLGALAWVAANLIAQNPADWQNLALAVVTADHKIEHPSLFQETVKTALEVAERTGGLVTIGIQPSRAETGFGYIEADRSQPLTGLSVAAFRSLGFREKPSSEEAERYLKAGRFLWNSGMFFWTLGAFAEQMAHAQPEAQAGVLEMAEAIRAGDYARAEVIFAELPNLSIDHALMEKAELVYVVEGTFPWDDVGAWDALERTLPLNDGDNVVRGDTVTVDVERSIVINEADGVVICVLGVEDLVVVTTPDAVLVCPKDRAQEVRKLVEELRKRGSDV